MAVDPLALLTLRSVSLAHDTLDVAFACVAEPPESIFLCSLNINSHYSSCVIITEGDRLRVDISTQRMRRAWLSALPNSTTSATSASALAADALSHRFSALCALLVRVLVPPPLATSASSTTSSTTSTSIRRPAPIRAIVALALRVLAVASVVDVAPRTTVNRHRNNDEKSSSTPTAAIVVVDGGGASADDDVPITLLARGDATTLLPKLRQNALDLLRSVVLAFPSLSIRYADVVCFSSARFLVKLLNCCLDWRCNYQLITIVSKNWSMLFFILKKIVAFCVFFFKSVFSLMLPQTLVRYLLFSDFCFDFQN